MNNELISTEIAGAERVHGVADRLLDLVRRKREQDRRRHFRRQLRAAMFPGVLVPPARHRGWWWMVSLSDLTLRESETFWALARTRAWR